MPKTITITSISVGGGGTTITIGGTIATQSFGQPHQQVSISGFADGNGSFARLLCLTDQALFVKRTGANSVAILLEGLAQLGVVLEPGLTWPPRFSTQPTPATVAAGSNTSFTVVQDVNDELAATFQWYRSTDGGNTWTAISGATTPNDGQTAYTNFTTATLGITAAVLAMNGYLYKCTATNGAGSTDSTVVALTVTGAAPGITGNPTNQSCVHNSTTATFNVTATGSSLAYQWQVSVTGTSGWTNIVDGTLGNPGPYSGSTTAALTVTPTTTAQNGYHYRCVVTNPNGNATSTAAQITVT